MGKVAPFARASRAGLRSSREDVLGGLPWAGWRGRVAVGAAMPVVGLCRLYVGAHLPLDVLGGAALGVIVDAVLALDGRRSPPPPAGAASR